VKVLQTARGDGWNQTLQDGDVMENNVQDLRGANLGPMSKAQRVKALPIVAIILAAVGLAVVLHYKDVLCAH
jgi:hypothetical protein